ncbi:type II toxin-antitoxin system YafQ family toxin [Marinobacter algicola]|uniref:Uncharacterized protein n=1 Tax=Marinobacter algicola DG893 TaxID=443152 RepID=A6EVY8_9GAMM|nr:type II toxin-antitoxin system YafQ family toxin [Marinobacter algicola]EDM49175.1 hypothetical protein MDG893_07255 [Marinobacter algicola DG893]
MLALKQGSRFKKDMKACRKQELDLQQLKDVIETLQKGEPLEDKHRDHGLSGHWNGWRDCHIAPDWVLIYRVEGDELELARTGSHAKLFG